MVEPWSSFSYPNSTYFSSNIPQLLASPILGISTFLVTTVPYSSKHSRDRGCMASFIHFTVSIRYKMRVPQSVCRMYQRKTYMSVLRIKLWYPSSQVSSPTGDSMNFIQLKMLLPANSSCLTCCPTCTCSLTCCPTCTCSFYFTIRLSKFTNDIIIHTCMQEASASYLDGNTNQTHIFHGFPSILPCKCCIKATAISFLILPRSFPIIQHYTI
jgi:hypothetical protein